MRLVLKLLPRSRVNPTAKTTAIARRHALSETQKGGALNDVAVKKRNVASASDDCSDGFRSAPGGICQLCSAAESPHEEEICRCTEDRNTVLGCKQEYDGNPSCTPRAAARAECTARGFTLPINATEYTRVTTTPPNATHHGGAATSQLLEHSFTSTASDTTKLGNEDTNQLSGESLVNGAIPAGFFILLVTVLSILRLKKYVQKRKRRRQALQGNPSNSNSDRSSLATSLQDVCMEPSNKALLLRDMCLEPSSDELAVLSTIPTAVFSDTQSSELPRESVGRNAATSMVDSQGIADAEALEVHVLL